MKLHASRDPAETLGKPRLRSLGYLQPDHPPHGSPFRPRGNVGIGSTKTATGAAGVPTRLLFLWVVELDFALPDNFVDDAWQVALANGFLEPIYQDWNIDYFLDAAHVFFHDGCHGILFRCLFLNLAPQCLDRLLGLDHESY